MRLSFCCKICRTSPHHKSSKCLICNSEITPRGRKVNLAEEERCYKNWKTYYQSLNDRFLVELEKVGNRKAKTSERSVTGSDRTDYNSKNGNHGTDFSISLFLNCSVSIPLFIICIRSSTSAVFNSRTFPQTEA